MTGVPTITDANVSVFISYDNGKYAISDGGWLSSGEYLPDSHENEEIEYLGKIIDQYASYFSIKVLNQKSGSTYFYRTTEKPELISSAVSDVANFVANVINTQTVFTKNIKEENESRQFFRNRLNNYFKTHYGENDFDSNNLVKLRNDKSVRINGVLRVRDNRLIRQYSIMYITGQRSDLFIKDISKAAINFKIINDYAVPDSFYQRIAIINKSAAGFDRNKSELYLKQLESVIEQEAILDIDENINDLAYRIPLN